MLRVTNLAGFNNNDAGKRMRPNPYLDSNVFYTPALAGGVSFATFDAGTASNVTLSGGDLVVTNTGSGVIEMGARVADALGKTSGKFYFETTLTSWFTGGSIAMGGIGTITSLFANIQNNGTTGDVLHTSGGQIWSVGGVGANLGTRANGNVAGFAVDMDNRQFWACVAPSGNWNNDAGADPATNTGGIAIPSGTMVPFVTFGGASTGPGNIVTANFGLSSFVRAVPAGFTPGWTT